MVSGLDILDYETCHKADRETEAVLLGTTMSPAEIWDKYGDRIADVSELLAFAEHPEQYSGRSVLIIRKARRGFSMGVVRNYSSARELWFIQPAETGPLSGLNWILLRKANSFQDQIAAGRYAMVSGSELLSSQTYHQVSTETELVRVGESMPIREVSYRFGNRIADASEFLDFGVKHPESYSSSILILWECGGGFCRGLLTTMRDHRVLEFIPTSKDFVIDGRDMVLLRK
jgi:hypothetical protein